MKPPPLKVLIADDSAICRTGIRHALSESPRLEIVGEATNGAEAVAMAERLRPDVVTMDLRMPKLKGQQAIQHILANRRVAVVIVTDHPGDVESVETTFGALSSGAMDILDKSCPDEQLRRRVIDLGNLVAGYDAPELLVEPHAAAAELRLPEARLVAIGASTGGPGAVAALLAALPRGFRTPVVLVQHMDEHFVDGFALWLRTETALSVRLARSGDMLTPGEILVAPPGMDMVMTGGHLAQVSPPKGAVHTPSVDAFFHSVAQELGNKAIGVLLSGMGDDGAAGLRAMRDRGAVTFAQDAKTSIVHGMPGAAVRRGAVMHVGRPEEIGAQLGLTVARRGASKLQFARPATRRILIVDDSQIVLDAIGATLEEAGYQVTKLDNPLSVAQVVRRESPDLVLIDVNMPAVSGDVVTRIMRLSVGSATKVALLSDLPDEELEKRARECGAVGYVKKTTDEDALVRKVVELIKRSAPPT